MHPLEYVQGTLMERGVGELLRGPRGALGTVGPAAHGHCAVRCRRPRAQGVACAACGSSSERRGLVMGSADWDRKTWLQIRALPLPSFINVESSSVVLSSSFLKWNMGMIMWGKVDQERKRDTHGEV